MAIQHPNRSALIQPVSLNLFSDIVHRIHKHKSNIEWLLSTFYLVFKSNLQTLALMLITIFVSHSPLGVF